MTNHEQLHLSGVGDPARPVSPAAEVVRVFAPSRLTQARVLSGLTKSALAEKIGISAAAVGQWESGTTPPRPDHLARASAIMKVPVSFFAAGRPHAQLDASTAHFRSLRSTRASQRAKAIAFVEQVWELAYALEKRVQFPPVQLPGFFEGEFKEPIASDPVLAARLIRSFWGLGSGPIPHLVRSMEQSGLIVTLIPFAGPDTPRIDAFSTSRLPRPIAVLTPDRANDVFRHRFTAAHELGHILLHSNSAPGDLNQEREADVFAAELLTPRDVILPELPSRIDFSKFEQLSRTWGVSVKSLIYRSREVGLISEPTARRGYQRLAQLRESGYLLDEPVSNYDGEKPVLLKKAFDLAEQSHGLSLASLADELKWPIARVRELLGEADARPTLRLV